MYGDSALRFPYTQRPCGNSLHFLRNCCYIYKRITSNLWKSHVMRDSFIDVKCKSFINVKWFVSLKVFHRPQVEWRGLTSCARRNKACVFRKSINLGHFVISPKNSGTQIILEILTQIDWNLKIQITPFWGNKFPPPFLSLLHSTSGMWSDSFHFAFI